MHIAIAGNIGSGKTTLTKMLARHYGWTPRFEAVADNPYLSDYYKDIARWSFNLEVFFLKERFKDILEIAQAKGTIIQDRTIYEGVQVFTRNNYEQGNLAKREFDTYMELFEQLTSVIRLPDLMIYLRASVPHLVRNIQLRGRDYEQGMQIEYLQGINDRYDDSIFHNYKGRVLVVDVDEIDYEHNPADFEAITSKIDAELFGFWPPSSSPR